MRDITDIHSRSAAGPISSSLSHRPSTLPGPSLPPGQFALHSSPRRGTSIYNEHSRDWLAGNVFCSSQDGQQRQRQMHGFSQRSVLTGKSQTIAQNHNDAASRALALYARPPSLSPGAGMGARKGNRHGHGHGQRQKPLGALLCARHSGTPSALKDRQIGSHIGPSARQRAFILPHSMFQYASTSQIHAACRLQRCHPSARTAQAKRLRGRRQTIPMRSSCRLVAVAGRRTAQRYPGCLVPGEL